MCLDLGGIEGFGIFDVVLLMGGFMMDVWIIVVVLLIVWLIGGI